MFVFTELTNFQFFDDPLENYMWIIQIFFPFEWEEFISLWPFAVEASMPKFIITPFWTSYSPIISVSLISLFLLTLGLALPQKPKFIKFLNIIGVLYILIVLYTLPFQYINARYIAIEDMSLYPELVSDQYKEMCIGIKEHFYHANNQTFNWYPNSNYYSNFFFIIASIAVICALLGTADKFYSTENNKIEFLLLVIFIYIGAIILLNSADFICSLILLECIAFASYVLVGFERKNKFSSSSGIKYLILGSVPGGFFVLGVTLLYKNYGSFFLYNLENVIFDILAHCETSLTFITPDMFDYLGDVDFEYDHIALSAYVAIVLVLANLLFKLTAAPLHMWAPSIYGSAPLATTTFLSIFSKLTIVFFSIYLYTTIFYLFNDIINIILLSCGLLSIICGILGAFSEKLIKRFFVYSSMGHVGFMLLGIAVSDIGLRSTINYLLVYVFSAYILWFILMYLTKKTTHLTNLKALCINHPVLSFILSITMFSLSGIPPLAGFFVKFEIFYSILQSGYFSILLFLFVLTVFSFFYYLRVIKIVYFENTKKIVKNKNQDLIKLRVLSILVHILLFFTVFVSEPFLIIIENTIHWLFIIK